MRREGKRTFFYEEGAWIRSRACMAGQKESEGPLGNTFDQILEDDLLGQKSWEFAESEMLRRTVELCASKADMSSGDIGALLAGDLNAQIISAGFAARQLGVPFLGLYGACSTFVLRLVARVRCGARSCPMMPFWLPTSRCGSARRFWPRTSRNGAIPA